MAGGEIHVFRLERTTGQNLLVTVTQHGIDVAVTLRKADESALGIIDEAETRHGFERFLVSIETAAVAVEVTARKGAPGGRYRIDVRDLPTSSAEFPSQRSITEAALLASQGREAPRRRALDLYRQGIQHWRDLGKKRDEARSLLGLAVAHQALGEAQPMLERLEEALHLFAALQDRQGEADTLNYLGIAQTKLGRYRDAIASHTRSLEISRALGDQHGEALTSQNICLTRLYLGESREAITCYEGALHLLAKVGAPVAEVFNGLGGAYSQLGEPRKAREHYIRALELSRAAEDQARVASLLNNLGLLLADQGDLGAALDYYGQALEAQRKLGDLEWEARILNNRGLAYLSLGEAKRALDHFKLALPIRRALKDYRGELNTLDNLGFALERLGEVTKAIDAYEQALKIAREIENPAGEAASLNLLAQGRIENDDLPGALEVLEQSVALHQRLGYRGGLALALQRTGEVEARLGKREKGLSSLKEALALNRELDDRPGQAGSLAALAEVERELGRLDEASNHAEEAIRYIESMRATVGEPNLRASFLASQQLAFELAIVLRMELDRKQPGKGHAEAALGLSERARARSLLDLLQEAGTEIRRGIDQELQEKAEGFAYRFSVNARQQRTASAEKRAHLERELTELLAQADRLETEIRRRDPRYAAFVEPLDSAGIRGLLDRDTLLLEYRLGEKRSFLWLATAERVAGFELPSLAEIEGHARQAYDALHRRAAEQSHEKQSETLRALSSVLLAPVADRLPGKRLVIVADGALHYVPFAALPDPSDPAGPPLVANHEVVALPSASVLAVQRRLLAGRPRASKAVAIFADPVFSPWDSRLRRTTGGKRPAAPPPVSNPANPSLGLQRLVASGHEAAAIVRLLPRDQVFTALGLQASRSKVLGTDLAPYRIVHFATHGLIDSTTPRLSALALSMFDEKGQEQEGLLGLSDIYNLDLSADLVVLSGCETALGREIRGEGLVGLTQGFLYAGAERVMASVWRVEDRATAELMSGFYGAMLKEKLPPPAALRSAQLAIRGHPEWQDPFYWAPFVLQGDWR